MTQALIQRRKNVKELNKKLGISLSGVARYLNIPQDELKSGE
jgi:DNA-binding Xre family transcriptional regulator